MALPFGLGCAIAYGLYNEFRDEPGTEPVAFGTYVLFIGVAMAITAFPVLCRILTELKLLSTPVGIIVLSAGVSNDIVGWILLALCVALVNSGSGLTALWVLLTALGYTLFLVFAVKPAFMWILRKNRSLETGPSQSIIALTLLMALTSAFFTGVIGIHPIFGAFMAGLICPHEGGFAIKVTEKIEDLVSALFLPLYFALSGLSTNLGLLDNGITWAYVIAVIAVAFFGKFIAAAGAARINGLVWRESFTIGALMSCKGLVELIVLNIGLQAKILSQRTFTIFVVMALVTTFMTTPLTAALYPPWYQKKLEDWKKGLIDWDTGRLLDDGINTSVATGKLENAPIKDLLVYLSLDSMPGILTFMSLLGGSPKEVERIHPARIDGAKARPESARLPTSKRPVSVHGVRMVELTDRDSSVMQVSEAAVYSYMDPIINTFRNFGRLYNLLVSGEVVVAPESAFAEMLTSQASRDESDLLLLPWSGEGGYTSERQIYPDAVQTRRDTTSYEAFVHDVLESATCNTAVLVNRGLGGNNALDQKPSMLRRRISGMSINSHRERAVAPVPDRSHHIFMPFFGGADGHVALRLVLQLAESPDITATIIHFSRPDVTSGLDMESSKGHGMAHGSGSQHSKSAKAVVQETTELRDSDTIFFEAVQRSLPSDLASRVIMESRQSSSPMDDAMARAAGELGQNSKNAGDLIVVGRRSGVALSQAFESASGPLGAAAEQVGQSELKASVLVVQGRGRGA